MSFWQLRDVSYRYHGGDEVLSGISFDIQPGERVAILGPNGSGKTTLGKLMMGMLRPSFGTILLNGRDISTYSLADIGAMVGYLFQDPERQLFTGSVLDEVSFGLRFGRNTEEEVHRKAMDILERVDLAHAADRFPFNLSRGEKQRLAMAAVLVLRPQFLLLDEPTTGLDRARRRVFRDLLKRVTSGGTGFALITHDREIIDQAGATRILKVDGRAVSECSAG